MSIHSQLWSGKITILEGTDQIIARIVKTMSRFNQKYKYLKYNRTFFEKLITVLIL